MKNQGLKGVTDATQFCKSMYAKGGTANKNQIIRSMKSYEVGGTTGMMLNNTMSEEMCGPGRPCHKSRKRANNQRLRSAGVSRSNRRRMR